MPQTKNSICHYISEQYNSVTIIPQVKTIMIHFGLPTTFFAKYILHSALESCFTMALTLPQTVFEIGCGNFFSNLDYCINYAFCSSSLFSQIFTNFSQNIYQSHCLIILHMPLRSVITLVTAHSVNSSSLKMLSRPLTRDNWLSWPGSERRAPVCPPHVQTTLCTLVQSSGVTTTPAQ